MIKKHHIKKAAYPFFLLISAVIASFLILWALSFYLSIKSTKGINYGITYSASYAKELGLDEKEVFDAAIHDLNIKKIRLPVYWNTIEKTKDNFNYKEYDALLNEAGKNNIDVVLAVGFKLPRWPECFQPDWAIDLDKKAREERILKMVESTIDHFKDRTEIVAWQVENEPFLNFGVCSEISGDLIDKEVAIVRSKDSRPIIVTDSGELGFWIPAMQKGDLMGTTLYKTVWNPILGVLNYPIPPIYYHIKGKLVRALFAQQNQGVIISELQAEPWTYGSPITQTSIQDQVKLFSLKQFKDTVVFARQTGISEQYLWGLEWWYFMREHNHPEYWEFAKTIFMK